VPSLYRQRVVEHSPPAQQGESPALVASPETRRQ